MLSGMARIAIIGGGNIGEALLAGLLRAGRQVKDLVVAEKNPTRAKFLSDKYAVLVTTVPDAVDAATYVIVAVKPTDVQNLIGVLPEFNRMRRSISQSEQNQMSIRVELQADCFAGIWGHYTAQKGLLERGDLEEALNAAEQIGDDTLQRRTQGYVVPESFNHGTSAQRQEWFARGFETGRLEDRSKTLGICLIGSTTKSGDRKSG